ncbi:hypothetical protein [Archangium violaceum]|uniref:hypothetical protein n=1 Tax=Archangium violaceum TaxID=83451 RepID=UPI001EF0D002|nr:hypothetical protein [Archangium violaceum]
MPKDWRRPLDPPAEYKRLRKEAPITRVRVWDGSTPWLISRYEDAHAALGDPRLSLDFRLPGFPHTSPTSAARLERTFPFPFRADSEYRVQRAMLVQEFSSRRMEVLRPRIQRTVDEALDAMLAGPRPTDLIAAFALPVAIRVICDLLGVSHDDHVRLHGLSCTIGSPRHWESLSPNNTRSSVSRGALGFPRGSRPIKMAPCTLCAWGLLPV